MPLDATSDLIVVPASGGAIGEHMPLSDDARKFVRASLAPSTLRRYKSAWQAWSLYAEARGVEAMCLDVPLRESRELLELCRSQGIEDVDGYYADLLARRDRFYVTVTNWIAHSALHGKTHAMRANAGRDGQALASIRTAVAAISTMHKLADRQFDSRHPLIKRAIDGIRRERPEAQRQAKAMPGSLVLAVLRGLGDSPLDRRDAALIGLGYACARRRSELVGLDWHQHGQGDGWLAVDGEHITLTIMKHKTMTDEPLVISVPRARNKDLTAAIERWIAVAKIEPGKPLFQGLAKGGRLLGNRLHGHSVSGIIKARIARHLITQGTDPDRAAELADKYSGHSLRSGFCVSAAEAGSDPLEIATVSKHKSLSMIQRYTKQADDKRRSPHNRIGVGLGSDDEE